MFSRHSHDAKLEHHRQLVFNQIKYLLGELKVQLAHYDVGATLAERATFLRDLTGKLQETSFESSNHFSQIKISLKVEGIQEGNSQSEPCTVIFTLENLSVGKAPDATTGKLELRLKYNNGKFNRKQSRAVFEVKTGYSVGFSMPIQNFCDICDIPFNQLDSFLDMIINYFHSRLNREKKNGSIK